MEVKNRLKEIRMKEYLMSSKEFSNFIGVKISTYSNWELGNNIPTLDNCFEIAKKLNKEITEIWYVD